MRTRSQHLNDIGSLSGEQKAELGRMVSQGLPLEEIRRRLGEAGKGLTREGLARWSRKWLKEQQQAQLRRLSAELAARIEREARGEEVQGAAVELANAQLFNVLSQFDPESLARALKGDVENYARIIRALVNLSENSLKRAELAARKEGQAESAQVAGNAGFPKDVLDTLTDVANLL